MKDYIEKRAIRLALHMIETGDTVRATGERFGIGKSTVHYDVTERLEKIDYALYEEVGYVLMKNLSERHVRGGESTKRKYEKLHPSHSAGGDVEA